jgi:hypothetical protein
MPQGPQGQDVAYATFIEDCRQERGRLFGLIEALEGHRMNPGMPIAIPDSLVAATSATLVAFQNTVAQLNTLIDAYEANSGA